MAAEPRQKPLEELSVVDRDEWADGPPHDTFKRLRRECPIHWSEIHDYPEEEGLWSVTKAEDVRTVSLDWRTFSSSHSTETEPSGAL